MERTLQLLRASAVCDQLLQNMVLLAVEVRNGEVIQVTVSLII